jgi:uncharacterized protein DUF4013
VQWAIGVAVVLLSPVLFIVLFGYAIAAIRAAEREPSSGPPPWHWSRRLLWDGAWTAIALAISVTPFVLAHSPTATLLARSGVAAPYPQLLALLFLFFLWGLLLLVLAPRAAATFAATSNPRDLFDIAAAVRGVRTDFASWNLTVAAIVTAWAIGVACVGLLCVGIVPGIYYAILVSAHAAAALHRTSPGPRPSAR